MARDVNHVIGARHDIKISVLINLSRIAGFVISRIGREVTFAKPLFGIPQGWQRAGGQGQLDRDRAERACRLWFACLVQNLHIIAGHRHRGGADLDRQRLEPRGVADDGVAGFGLPPMVIDRFAQLFLRPDHGIGVGPFPRQIKRTQARNVVFPDLFALGVFAFDGADRGGGGKEAAHIVFRDNAPEGARIRCTHGLAFEHDCRVAMHQRAIADIAVAHDPAHIGRGPEHVAGIDVIDVLHRPVQCNQMASGLAHDALGRAGRARGVKNVGGVVALDRNAGGRGRAFLRVVPIQVAPRYQIAGGLFALQDQAEIGFMVGLFDGPVQQRLVGHHARRFQPAGRGDDGFGGAVVDPHGQLV